MVIHKRVLMARRPVLSGRVEDGSTLFVLLWERSQAVKIGTTGSILRYRHQTVKKILHSRGERVK